MQYRRNAPWYGCGLKSYKPIISLVPAREIKNMPGPDIIEPGFLSNQSV